MKLIISIILALLCAPIAQAAVSVSPVHLNVVQNSKTTSVQFINDTDQASIIDVQIKKWLGQNGDGSDILEDTDAVILSRPVVSVAANSSATIRLIVKERSGNPEDPYRVLVTDITPPTKDGKVSVRMNSVLPLFVLANKTSKGTLEFENVLKNTGNRHVRISGYTDKTGKIVNVLRYVFPGQSIALPVKSAADVIYTDDIY